jgi:hypothetical protein
MRAHLRTEIHSYMEQSHLAPATAKEHPLNNESIRERIQSAKEKLGS